MNSPDSLSPCRQSELQVVQSRRGKTGCIARLPGAFAVVIFRCLQVLHFYRVNSYIIQARLLYWLASSLYGQLKTNGASEDWLWPSGVVFKTAQKAIALLGEAKTVVLLKKICWGRQRTGMNLPSCICLAPLPYAAGIHPTFPVNLAITSQSPTTSHTRSL